MASSRVLIAGPSEFSVEVIKNFLKHSPVKIFTAREKQAAIRTAIQVQPDLMVVDKALAGNEGLAFFQAIKTNPSLSATSVILLVEPGEVADEKLLKEAGCDVVLRKPLDRRIFLETGRSLLAKIDRREPRILCRAGVVCQFEDEVFYGTIEDISPNGMFVGSDRQMSSGQQLNLKFLLPWNEIYLIETKARIAWVNRSVNTRKTFLPTGFGVEFLHLGTDEAAAILAFMHHSLMRQPRLEE